MEIKNPQHNYHVENQTLENTETIKDLGIYVTSTLSWSYYCNEIAKKANKVANSIQHTFRSTDINLYVRAFDAYLQLILIYCSYVWNPILSKDIDVLENVQKRLTRITFYKCKLPCVSDESRLRTLNRCTCEHKRLILSLGAFYNCYNKFVSSDILNGFRPSNASMSLCGHSKQLFLPFCKYSIRKSFFTSRMLPI